MAVARTASASLQNFADSLGEELEDIIAGRYYRLGDIVLDVTLFELSELPDPSQKSSLIAMAYAVSLVVLDREKGYLIRRRIGTLQLLSYDSLSAAIRNLLPHQTADSAAVLAYRSKLK